MNKRIFIIALLAGSLVTVSSLPAQDNRNANTRQPTLEDRIDHLEQDQQSLKGQVNQLRNDVTDLQDRVQRLEGGQQPPPTSPPAARSSGSGLRTSSAETRTRGSGEEQSYDVFYRGLQSGGHWFDDPTYGEVWQPDVAVSEGNWRPYSDGHWAYTDRGWTWISNEDFGWATYHYGRWARRSDTGWIWIPGSRWAPAWVSWRESSDHVGWAPLPPEVGDDSPTRVEGWVDSYYDIGPAAYFFVKTADLSQPSYRDVILLPERNVEFFTQTKNVTDIVYDGDVVAVHGPRYEQVASQAKIPSYKLSYVAENEGRFGINTRGDQLEVMAPSAKLQRNASIQPQVEKTLGQAQLDRGWQEIDKQKAAQLKQTIEQQAPVPANLPPKPAPPKPVMANSQNQPAQTGRRQEPSGNPPASEASPQNQARSATEQATPTPGRQPPRPESTPARAEGARPESPTTERERQTRGATSGESNAPREERRQPAAASPTPQRSIEQREQRQRATKPAPPPAEEPKNHAPTEQAPPEEKPNVENQSQSERSKEQLSEPRKQVEPRREQPANDRAHERTSRPETQREEPAKKEQPLRQQSDLERRKEKQSERTNTEPDRSEKKELKQEKSRKEESASEHR
jgi:hypothetical protein